MADSLHRRLMYLCNLSYALAPGAVALPQRAGELGRRDAAIGLGPHGAVVARNLTGSIGRDLATSNRWPEWKAGSEFKAIRDASAATRRD